MTREIISNGVETVPSPEVKGQQPCTTTTVNPTTAGEQRHVYLLPSIVSQLLRVSSGGNGGC